MIGVEPVDLILQHQFRPDQAPVDRRQRQRLESVHGDVAASDLFRRRHEDEVFDTDAVRAFLVVAGFV